MTALHFHFHHRRFHYYTLRYLLPLLLAIILFFLLASPVRGQVWVDESQLHGKLPSWVDPAYEKAPSEPIVVERPMIIEPLPPTRVWVPPVTRTIVERVWVRDRYEWRTITHWVDGHMICERVYVLVEPAHWETRCREIVIVPGHWEYIEPRLR